MSRVAPAPARTAARSRAQGLTLAETALAVGVLALVALGALAVHATLLKNLNLTLIAADVTAIRAAVRQALDEDEDEDAEIPGAWSALAQRLPGRLGDLAEGDADATLGGANPWGGHYTIRGVPGDAGAWVLEAGGIPADLQATLRERLAGFDPGLDRSPSGCAEGSFCVGFDERP